MLTLLKKTLRRSFTTLMKITSGKATGYHLTRYAMYARLGEVVAQNGVTSVDKLLAISHSKSLAEVVGIRWQDITEADYPDENILALTSPDAFFDAVVSDQVFEHIEGDPFTAMDETLRVLKPGGLLIHTTCFMNHVHGDPDDYWRFTPESLALLLRGKADVIEAGGWGNRTALLLVALGFRYLPIPHATWHPLHKVATRNDPVWPISTWVVARKT